MVANLRKKWVRPKFFGSDLQGSDARRTGTEAGPYM